MRCERRTSATADGLATSTAASALARPQQTDWIDPRRSDLVTTVTYLGLLTLTKRLEDESKQDESEEEDIEFLVARKDATIALQSTEQALDFAAPLVDLVVIVPRGLRGSSGVGRPVHTPAPRPVGVSGCLGRRGPSPKTGYGAGDPNREEGCAPLAHREPVRGIGTPLKPFQHPRQPDEFCWCNPLGTCRWTVGRFFLRRRSHRDGP